MGTVEQRWVASLVLSICLASATSQAALPLTPSTTYIANSTPAIKAADLNALQAYLAGIYSAIFSVKALVIDGTGGASVAGTAGTLQLSGAFGSATTYPSTSIPSGRLYSDTVSLGYCRAYWDGASMVMVRGANVNTVTRNGIGDYTVLFNSAMVSPATAEVAITMGVNPSDPLHGFVGNPLIITDGGSGKLSVRFLTLDPNAAAKVDTNVSGNFFIEVKGR